jgi:carbamoyl-phosphate synthase large subunit
MRLQRGATVRPQKVVILGGGPNRIGQGIEFDYCCCHAAFALKDAGYEAIMVNCNPETVSTDYDTSDRLYFEPLTDEDVLEILTWSRPKPARCSRRHRAVRRPDPAEARRRAGKGRHSDPRHLADMIDLAEDRDRFQKLLQKLDLAQPNNGIAYSVEQEAVKIATDIGFPLVVRPSYVLGGRAMRSSATRRPVQLPARHRAGTGARGHQGALPQRQDRPDQHAAGHQPAAV